ncbi:hypothetical protein [Waltera sp.]|uniref:hypothetical protein n=1 Tax=Waltera sp. TaxID=2815806 RepID=UPI00399FA523
MEKLHRVCKNFTRHDKKTRTILLCEMLEYTNVFLEAAFRAEGYSFETLKNPVKDRTLALRYISNDYCYPTVLILAQFLEYLESGERDPEEITFMEPQAGGACRAGNIYNLLQRVLYRMVEQGQLGVCPDSRNLPEPHGRRKTYRLSHYSVTVVRWDCCRMLWRSDHVPVPAGEALRTESGRDGPHPQSGGKETVREHSETQERTAHQREKLPVCLRSIFEGTGETREEKESWHHR